MLKSNRIAFDIDGVILDFYPVMRDVFKKYYNLDIKETDYGFTRLPNVSKEEFENFIDNIILTRSDELCPYNNTYQNLLKIQEYFQQIILFVTARHEVTKGVTYDSLKKHFPELDFRVEFIKSLEKPNYLLKNNINYWVDDMVEVVNMSSKLYIQSYLMNRPWNRNIYINERVIKVNNLKEVYNNIFRTRKGTVRCMRDL